MFHRWRNRALDTRRQHQRAVQVKIRIARRNGEAVSLDRDELRVLFDRLTRRELGLSADEFLSRLDRGDLPDSPAVEHLTLLAGGARTR